MSARFMMCMYNFCHQIIAGVVEDERASSDDNVTVAFQVYTYVYMYAEFDL